jgi:2,4-dienoyl-CoA reductase-like NADH-dependent reductase (Old Yellow Enzyme family)
MIYQSIKINKLKLENRVVVSPMCQYSAINGHPSSWHYKHLGSLVKSGASMVILESTAVNKEGRITKNDLCLYNEEHKKSFKKLILFLKSIKNIPIFIQLSHAGRKGSAEIPWIKSNSPLKKEDGWQTISSLGIKKDLKWPKPKHATEKDIKKIINDFAKSAKFAISSGFDGIEIHMAHGYLIHQFLSPIVNKRKDSYGGSFEKRSLLAVQITKNLKKICKNKTILGVRMTATDHLKKGININESLRFVKNLETLGVNYACISSGGIKTKTNLKMKIKGFRSNLTKKIKVNTSKMIIGTTGRLGDINFLNKKLKNNFFDLAFVGRPFLKNPYWMFTKDKKIKDPKKVPKQYLRGHE